jgi:biotin transport system ATP-binding protein
LDLRNVNVVVRALAELPQQVVLLTHHLEMLRGFDRVLVLDQGRVVCDARPDAAIEHYLALMAE